MRIQLFDRGLLKGKQLFVDLQNVCRRLQIDNDPEYSHDMHRPYSLGISGNTVLIIDNEVVFVDKYPSSKELENIISDFIMKLHNNKMTFLEFLDEEVLNPKINNIKYIETKNFQSLKSLHNIKELEYWIEGECALINFEYFLKIKNNFIELINK